MTNNFRRYLQVFFFKIGNFCKSRSRIRLEASLPVFAPLQNWRILITAPFLTVPVPMPCARADLPVPRAYSHPDPSAGLGCQALRSLAPQTESLTEGDWVPELSLLTLTQARVLSFDLRHFNTSTSCAHQMAILMNPMDNKATSLPHWIRDKIADVWQVTFSSVLFSTKFDSNILLMV